PVVAANVRAVLGGSQPQAQYGGYAGCPITIGDHKVFLTEADYTGNYAPKIPFRTAKPRRSMWLLKRFGLAPLYWYGMLRGRAWTTDPSRPQRRWPSPSPSSDSRFSSSPPVRSKSTMNVAAASTSPAAMTASGPNRNGNMSWSSPRTVEVG